jgi:ATP-dependent Clp protease ATP-binding subunit ClpA
VRERLGERHVDFRVTEQAKAALVTEGFDPTFGARPLRRTIQRRVENELAKRVLRGEFAAGDVVVVDLDADGGYTFAAEHSPAEQAREELAV